MANLFSDESSIAQNVVESTAAVHTDQEAGPSQTQPLDTSSIPFAIGEMHEVLPLDQLRMIDNINSLISEVSPCIHRLPLAFSTWVIWPCN